MVDNKSFTGGKRKGICPFEDRCMRFVSDLKIKGKVFDFDHNICYCLPCHKRRGDEDYLTRGQPPKMYGLPIGWCKIGLKIPAKVHLTDAEKKWHRAFHGTKRESILQVLKTGELLMPGDEAVGGHKVNEREGHFNDEVKPKGFNTKQIFVSPSIHYAGQPAYASPSLYHDFGNVYAAKTAFQVYIEPGSYEVKPETIGADDQQIDRMFANHELEWSTRRRGSTVLVGLLVWMQDITDNEDAQKAIEQLPRKKSSQLQGQGNISNYGDSEPISTSDITFEAGGQRLCAGAPQRQGPPPAGYPGYPPRQQGYKPHPGQGHYPYPGPPGGRYPEGSAYYQPAGAVMPMQGSLPSYSSQTSLVQNTVIIQQPVPETTVTIVQKPPPAVETYRALAIFTCLCCNPVFGLIAIVFSTMASNEANSGNTETAMSHAKVARWVSVAGILIGLGLITTIIIVNSS